MKLDADTRLMLRSRLVAAGLTSTTDEDATAEEYLALALDDLDEWAAFERQFVEWRTRLHRIAGTDERDSIVRALEALEAGK